ncbi:MAG: hypothetical protein JSW11_13695 [Candidatus Heimdallarchaeota archaeon]|nr:MAG: hypothetical protein JSW11_13695 [Candidatus Heimdallarchaeota archaeon]
MEGTGNWIDYAISEAPPIKKEFYEEITPEEGQSLAEELGLSYYETRPTDKKISGQIFHDWSLRVLQKEV